MGNFLYIIVGGANNKLLIMIEKRICKICSQEKDITLFALSRKSVIDSKQFYKMTCKSCDNTLKYKTRKSSKDYYNKRKARYILKKDKILLRGKITRLKRLYNLSFEDIENMKSDQDNKCAICNKEKPLVIDHCHKSGKVRKLLCNHCNTGIGSLMDDPEILRRAIQYILEHKL